MAARNRKLWIGLGAAALVLLVAVAALPLLVDVNRYRGLIEAQAEQALGREVALGEMSLSLRPFGVRVDDVKIGSLPGEGPGELLTVDRLRVGARLMPLLGKRLEVTGILLDGPKMTLERGADGTWNVERIVAKDEAVATGSTAEGEAGSFLVESLSLSGGRITLRDVGDPLEIVLSDLDLNLRDVALDRPLEIDLSASIAAGGGAEGKLGAKGSVGPVPPGGASVPMHLSLQFEDVPAELLARWIDAPGSGARLSLDISGDVPRAFDVSGELSLPDAVIRFSDVEVRGERVDVRAIHVVAGSTDVAGSITVDGFDAPAIRFDLASKRADFGELYSLVAPEEEASRDSTGGGAATSAAMNVDGKLRVDSGSFDTLDFADLETTVRWAGDVLTLAPLSASLYDGSFAGGVVTDLGRDEPAFEVNGDAKGIDLGAFLADNLEGPGLLAGRFTGKVATTGSGIDFESIVRSLDGSGSMEIAEGHVGGLDVLESLSRVSGVFGEDTVRQLSSRLAAEGTGFSRLSGKVRLADGTMQMRELRLDSPDFSIDGKGEVDLLAAILDGEFRLTLSQAISESMRAEKSRAGALFWNAKSGRVELPFTLNGPFSEPSANIDFETVARRALGSEAEKEVRKLLGDDFAAIVGGGAEDSVPEAPPPAAEGSETLLAITETEWSGPFLARDLKIRGRVRTDNVARAELIVTDAGGKEIHSDPIAEVAEYLASGASPTDVAWRVKLDGKRLVLAKKPFTLRLLVTDSDGASYEATKEVR